MCSSVPITSDTIDEEEENFIVRLSTTSTFAGLILNPEVAIVHIIDNDRELHGYMCELPFSILNDTSLCFQPHL